ncbi:flavodoxin domain-containing protein [Chakrabartyella piscis]|uniref:flavodoxin domain-containing protein n=1 Tax=Chakrabartyella piscis TaxID=2918914 RepID=UPI002958B3B0|nr:flavodoxin domain-containing protein [Chakrabartyella piscis]
MSKVAVIYWSGTGNTEAMANAIADGAKGAGAEVSMFSASEVTKDIVKEFGSIAFGCPSMGAEVLEESEFQPMWDDVKGLLNGKKLVLFGSYGWGDGEWMRNWADEADNFNVLATPICQEAPDATVIAELNDLGKALA